MSLRSKSTCICQSLSAFSGPRSGCEGLDLCFSPSRTNDGGCRYTCWLMLGRALMETLLHSSLSARHLRTWLCLHVYLPLVRLVLQPTMMCFSIAGVAHWGHAGSFPNHSCRFTGDGSTQYVARTLKLNLLESMPQSSLHESFFFSTSSHVIQRPCLACATALERLVASSCRCTSSTT